MTTLRSALFPCFGATLSACEDTASTDLDAIGASKVDVCHVSGAGVSVLNVSTSAALAHLGHGDVFADTWFVDADGDGYGEGSAQDCPDDGDPTGWATVDGDCDDADSTASPDEAEVCGDGIDNNCDGQVDEDCGPVECPCFTADELQEIVDMNEEVGDAYFAAGGDYYGGGTRPYYILSHGGYAYVDVSRSLAGGVTDWTAMEGTSEVTGILLASYTQCYVNLSYTIFDGTSTPTYNSSVTSMALTDTEQLACAEEVEAFVLANPGL